MVSDSEENDVDVDVVSMETSGQEWKLYAAPIGSGCVLPHFWGIVSVPVLLKHLTFVA